MFLSYLRRTIATQKALVLRQYGKNPKLEDWPVPELKPGQILVKLEGAAINPSDRLIISGVGFFKIPIPNPAGRQGTGRVIKVNGDGVQQWKDKRVSFIKYGGTWCEYAAIDPNSDILFEIDNDVDLPSAASGIVNPLTSMGMTYIFNATNDKKGLINTAAASSLGRMLNKRCQTINIPLLNIVNKQSQAQLLIKEGAKHFIVTKGNWQDEYKNFLKDKRFNVLFDSLGGGDVQATLVNNLRPNSYVYTYARLASSPSLLNIPELKARDVHMMEYYNGQKWFSDLPQEEKKSIKKNYSQFLKGDFSTQGYKQLGLHQLEIALQLMVSKATEGKITLVPK